MSKELEALKNIGLWGYQDSEGDLILCRINNKEDFAIIETALKNYQKLSKDYSIVVNEKIALCTMYAKEHRALEIIKKRKVRIGLLSHCDNASQYNHEIEFNGSEWQMLIQEEFDLLKEVLL